MPDTKVPSHFANGDKPIEVDLPAYITLATGQGDGDNATSKVSWPLVNLNKIDGRNNFV